MSLKLGRKYFSIIFIVAMFMGAFHHHNDLKQHNDCQVCTIQTNIANGDLPTESVYFTSLEIIREAISTKLTNICQNRPQNQLNARAPPKIS